MAAAGGKQRATSLPETIRRRAEKRVWYRENRDRILAYQKEWRARNKPLAIARYARRKEKGVYRAWQLQAKFGLSVQQYEEMVAAQENRCAICSTEFTGTPHVDHCHATGNVRGLLCQDCNFGIGRLGDDIARLESAINYLRHHAAREV